jgi:FkbM family methyltransferase
MARRFPKGRVFAFEPSPQTYEALCRNSSTFGNIQCIQSAVGAATGTVSFSGTRTPSALRRIQANETNRETRVPCITLSEWMDQHLTRLDFLKVDVEGFEADVLVPALPRLRTMRTRILFEFIPDLVERQEMRNGSLLEVMRDSGWTVHRLDQEGHWSAAHVRPDIWSNNYIAFPETKRHPVR